MYFHDVEFHNIINAQMPNVFVIIVSNWKFTICKISAIILI